MAEAGKAVGFDDLAVLLQRSAAARVLTAIAGPPGAGKSMLADRLAGWLNQNAPGSAAVLPMDGYHFDDMLLLPRGLRARKGAPETFDVAGLHHMLGRLRRNEEAEIAVPVFDRQIEIARAGARLIAKSVRHVIVEGNYLLLDRPGWSELRGLFDITVMVTVPDPVLRERLEQRWAGLSAEERLTKIEGNDLPNGRLVHSKSLGADFVYTS